MHPRFIVQRRSRAYDGITQSVIAIAQAVGVPVPEGLTQTNRDRELQALYRLEAVDAFLRSLNYSLLVEKHEALKDEHLVVSNEIIAQIQSTSDNSQADQPIRPKSGGRGK